MRSVPIFAWFLFVATTILYAFTAAPSVYGIHSDTLEFQLVAPTLGIAHPTGYPLYLMVGWLWSRVLFPFGTWAWRMNLLSAVTGGAAVTFLFLVVSRVQSGKVAGVQSGKTAIENRQLKEQDGESPEIENGAVRGEVSANWIGLAAAGLFASGAIWWSQTTIAEVYALHALFVAAILYCAMRVEYGEAEYVRVESGRALIWLFLLIALSLTHHRTTVLLLPGVAIYLLLSVPNIWHPSRQWIGWGLALLLPLLLYAYMPIRAAMGATELNGLYENSWRGFWDHMLARRFDAFLGENVLAVDRSFGQWVDLLRGQLGIVGLIFAGIGLGQLASTKWRAWLLVLLVLLANLIFVLAYRVADIEVFLLPVVMCTVILAAGGLMLVSSLGARIDPRASTWIARAGMILLLLPQIVSLVQNGAGMNWPELNRRDAWAEHNRAVEIAKVDFAAGSTVIGLEGEISALTYMQQAEGLAQNASGIIARAGDEAARIETVARLVDAGKPVYLTREVAGIADRFSFSAEGPLMRVWPRGEAQVVMPDQVQCFEQIEIAGGRLRLAGADVVRLDQPGADSLRATFYWRVNEPIAERLKLSLRLHDAGENKIVEDRFPLRQATYTEHWVVGELIRDVHYIDLPHEFDLSAAKTVLVIVYDAADGVEVGRVEIPLRL